MGKIDEGWDLFKEKLLKPRGDNMPDGLEKAMRDAFYLGAVACWSAFTDIDTDSDEMTPQDEATWDGINDDLKKYAAEVVKDRIMTVLRRKNEKDT